MTVEDIAPPTPAGATDPLLLAQAKIDQLGLALISARRIGAAIGIVMARRRLTYDEAFALLAQRSQDRQQKVRDLAEDILYIGDLPAGA